MVYVLCDINILYIEIMVDGCLLLRYVFSIFDWIICTVNLFVTFGQISFVWSKRDFNVCMIIIMDNILTIKKIGCLI